MTILRRVDAFIRVAVCVMLAAYLLFAHGCHGDKDNELFTQCIAGAGK